MHARLLQMLLVRSDKPGRGTGLVPSPEHSYRLGPGFRGERQARAIGFRGLRFGR